MRPLRWSRRPQQAGARAHWVPWIALRQNGSVVSRNRWSGAVKISVTVVVPIRNEAASLASCLSRLRSFERVVVVDSGSEDASKSIARDFGAQVVDFRWNGSFPKKRNWFLDNCEIDTDWVLFLDADELVTQDFCDEVASAIAGGKYVGFWLSYDNWFLGRRLRFGDTFRKLALFRRDAGRFERIDEVEWSSLDMEVHEHPVLQGPVGSLRSRVEHVDKRGLHAYISKHNEYSTWEARRLQQLLRKGGSARLSARLSARQRWKYRLARTPLLPAAYYLYCLIFKLGVLDGRAGFALARLKAQYYYHVGLKFAELHRASDPEERSSSFEGSGK
ncbi:glycosyltransferase family 2 protein [bacterium]|nr:glycosyltransferase family 2 protein [bacterium]